MPKLIIPVIAGFLLLAPCLIADPIPVKATCKKSLIVQKLVNSDFVGCVGVIEIDTVPEKNYCISSLELTKRQQYTLDKFGYWVEG